MDPQPAAKTLIDAHCHLAAVPDGENGCHLSERYRRGISYRFLLWRLGLRDTDPRIVNERYLTRLRDQVRTSRFVKQVVLLAMDGVYDREGKPDLARTHFRIPNDLVLRTCRENAEFLPGVSINPARRDALDELERCAEAGAALVKVLPNSMGFDPGDERFRPFYRALARHRMPFLSHCGHEYTVIAGDDSSVGQHAGDPARLQLALEEGVPVIAAHGCSTGTFWNHAYLQTFGDLVARFPNFCADTSALTLPNRALMTYRIRRRPELIERLTFGTDYPLPACAHPFLGAMGPRSWLRAALEANPFDKNVLLQQAMGLAPRSQHLERMLRREPACGSGPNGHGA